MSVTVAKRAREKTVRAAEQSLRHAMNHLARGANGLAIAELPVMELEADKLMRLVMALRASLLEDEAGRKAAE